MFFRAQNLGPLRDAEVDLSKDLIVLAGPNNSGKTYLAWSVYGLHRSADTLMDLDHWVRQLVESPDHAVDFAEILTHVRAGVAAEYKSRLHLCFAAQRSDFAAANVSLRASDEPGSDSGDASTDAYIFTPANRPGGGFTLQIRDPASERLEWAMVERIDSLRLSSDSHTTTTSMVASLVPREREMLGAFLGTALHSFVWARLFPRCTLFPAERIAVNIFAKELALKRTELVDEMVDADLDDKAETPMDLVRRKAGRYPWPIRDSLRVANDLANLSREKGPFAPLADEIETAVLGGVLSVSETGELLFSPRGSADTHLQMHLTASLVKSLSSLVFYFRYLAQPGDFLIIDEPELNLHPDNQRKITRLLAKAVHLGFKVMISTHSDYVIRELNQLVMLSRLPEGDAQKLGYDPESAIAPERLGVYLFDAQHSEPVPVDETGFSIKTIDDVVNQLNADEQRLYARLAE
jgi:hypothetical protein